MTASLISDTTTGSGTWPAAVRNGGALGLVATQIRTEFLQNWRLPEFMVGAVAVPVLLYAMFGLPNAGEKLPAGGDVAAFMMASLASYGLVSLAIFTFGIDVAQERGSGWWRVLRASPLPSWVYFAGKLCMAVLYGALIVGVMGAVAVVFGNIELSVAQWLRLSAVLLSGAIAFSTLGFALAFLARPRAASAIGNLIFLPLSFASGFFFPLSQLPAFLSDLAPYLPTYHYGQLVWRQVGSATDAEAFIGAAPGDPWIHVAWMVGSFVVFGTLALIGYRRDEQARYT